MYVENQAGWTIRKKAGVSLKLGGGITLVITSDRNLNGTITGRLIGRNTRIVLADEDRSGLTRIGRRLRTVRTKGITCFPYSVAGIRSVRGLITQARAMFKGVSVLLGGTNNPPDKGFSSFSSRM